jgi:ABC-2 type transport system permease protein
LLIAANAANMAISSNGMKRAGEIILTFQRRDRNKKTGRTRLYFTRSGKDSSKLFAFQYRQVNNPSGTFYDFLVWGLIGAVGHFPIMLFSATLLSTEKRKW